MKHVIVLLLCMLAGGNLQAAGEHAVMQADVDLSDMDSLRRGARIFVNYCLSCHSAAFMRYNRLGRDLGISDEQLKENFMFGTDKTGSTMTVALQREDGVRFFGVAPPDLSVIARARGPDWLYSFFMTFYRDASRPSGVNNMQFKDTAMPHVLWELQGVQQPVYEEETLPDGAVVDRLDHLVLVSPGMQTEEEYRETVRDLVNFLVYLGEPIQLKRYRIGVWVVMYLFLFLIIAIYLKKEYWKDVK